MKVEEAMAAVTPNILGSSGDTMNDKVSVLELYHPHCTSGLEATIFDLDGALSTSSKTDFSRIS
jgi:hypothetical protein